jgi:hypothetical protein
MRRRLQYRYFTTAIAVAGLTISLSAQTAASGTEWSTKLRHTAADQVAKQIDAIHVAKLPLLKRVN